MKHPRKFNNHLSFKNNESNNNVDRKTLQTLDSEPGYYERVISPMLAPGNENKLIYWLRSFGLIKPNQICTKAMTNDDCTHIMRWKSIRGEDLYEWQCSGCLEKRSIREDSIFTSANCSFRNAIRILFGWCKGDDIDTVANMLGLKNSIVDELYTKAANVAEKCMRSNIADWQLGGPGVVVIIDTYPEGCTNTNQIRITRPIICISEVKSIPQRYWLETLNHFTRDNTVEIADLKEEVLRIVQTIVRPGSILITPFSSTLCSYSDFEHLRMVYPTIVSTRDLARHDNKEQTLFSNLETIWKSVLDICEFAQFYNSSLIQQFVVSHMWRRRYAEESFELLLYEMSALQ